MYQTTAGSVIDQAIYLSIGFRSTFAKKIHEIQSRR
jgi:hypothetical protein